MNLPVVFMVFCLLAPSMASAAPLKLRPLSGVGFMEICRPEQQSTVSSSLTLYREPGLGRVADLDLSDIPLLSSVFAGSLQKRQFAVTRVKGEWVRIVYDEAGREGWFVPPRQWNFQYWERFLMGRELRLAAGLKKEYLQLHAEPSVAAPVLESMDRERRLRVLDLSDNWALVLVDMSRSGWFRWKDDDGRFLVSVE